MFKYLKNLFKILMIRTLTLIGKGHYRKKILFSSKRILELNFKKNGDFRFIQIGANDGVSFDFLYDFVIERNSRGLVIEPVGKYFEELKRNYTNHPNVIPVNYAIHPNLRKISMYKIKEESRIKYPDWVRGIASLDKDHHKKTNIAEADIEIEQIQADTLNNIYSTFGKGLQPQYFQIDTEGFDLEILKMIDFAVIKPMMIKYESVNLSGPDRKIATRILRSQKYFVFTENGDTVGIDIRNLEL